MQTSLKDHFEEKTDFADHYLEDLEKKYNWHEEVLPYAHLHKRFMFRLAIDERKYVQPVLSEGEFEFRKAPDVVDNFFHHGKPKYLGEYVEYWIMYFSTEGRYRCNTNKVMRKYKKKRDHLEWMGWSAALKHSTAADWEVVHHEAVYSEIIAITEHCNAVLSCLLKRMRRTNIKTAYSKCAFQNLQNLPEFVPFQQNRTSEHKQFRWYFEATKKGGNSGLNPAAQKLRLPKQSVHRMLVEFDEWLPALRSRH